MSSPAERFARARRRQATDGTRHPQLAQFAAGLDFELDDFQRRAAAALEEGRGVLVAAPTGAGKTVVGEFAVHLALATGRIGREPHGENGFGYDPLFWPDDAPGKTMAELTEEQKNAISHRRHAAEELAEKLRKLQAQGSKE